MAAWLMAVYFRGLDDAETVALTDAMLRTARDDGGKNWLMYGRDYTDQRWSPLVQITPANVKNLRVAWMYQTLAGINYDPAQPGFKHIILHPRPVEDLRFVKAWHKCLYGAIRSSWKRGAGQFSLDVTIPLNTTATIYIPAKDAARVLEGGQPANKSKGLRFLRVEEGNAVFEAGSGDYSFWSPL